MSLMGFGRIDGSEASEARAMVELYRDNNHPSQISFYT